MIPTMPYLCAWDAVDNAMFLGRGAGELPTASAVAGDVFEVMRNLVHGCCGRVSCTCYKELPIVPMEEVRQPVFPARAG